MKVVVADTGAIISLIHINQLDLIEKILGLLLKAKQKGLIQKLKPIFSELLFAGRYFSLTLINEILRKSGEEELKN